MHERGVERPLAASEGDPQSVKSAADVQPLAVPDQMTCAKFDFLPANAKPEVLRGTGEVGKRLMKIRGVLICNSRPPVASLFEAALKLCEESKVITCMPVGMEKISLQNVPGRRLGIDAESGVLIVLILVPYFTANR